MVVADPVVVVADPVVAADPQEAADPVVAADQEVVTEDLEVVTDLLITEDTATIPVVMLCTSVVVVVDGIRYSDLDFKILMRLFKLNSAIKTSNKKTILIYYYFLLQKYPDKNCPILLDF